MTPAEARGVTGSRLSIHLPSRFFFFCLLWEIMAATRLLCTLCLPLTPTRGSRVSVCPYYTAVRRKNHLSNSIISILYRASQHPLPVPRSSSNPVDFILILHLCCAVVLGLLWCFYCVGQHAQTCLYLFLPSVVVKPFGTSALTLPPVVKRSIAPESPNPDVHLCDIFSSVMVLKEKVKRKIHISKLNELS